MFGKYRFDNHFRPTSRNTNNFPISIRRVIRKHSKKKTIPAKLNHSVSSHVRIYRVSACVCVCVVACKTLSGWPTGINAEIYRLHYGTLEHTKSRRITYVYTERCGCAIKNSVGSVNIRCQGELKAFATTFNAELPLLMQTGSTEHRCSSHNSIILPYEMGHFPWNETSSWCFMLSFSLCRQRQTQ